MLQFSPQGFQLSEYNGDYHFHYIYIRLKRPREEQTVGKHKAAHLKCGC